MTHSTPVSFCFLLAPILSVLAQDLPAGLAGCTEVDCPNDGWDSCTVADESFAGIGLSGITGVPNSLDDISLVKGVHIEDRKDNDTHNGADKTRSFRSVYYIGTPPNVDVDELSGCAVVFNDPPTGHFPRPIINDSVNVDTRAAYGTCPDVIKQDCIDKLTDQARKTKYNGANPCSPLQSTLNNNPPDECSDLTGGGDGLGSFDVVSLGNLSTISKSDNASSNCWPVLPKSNNLAQLADDIAMGNYTNDGLLAEMYKITPVLTVFTSSNNSKSLVNETSASLTCLKVVTTPNIDNGTDTDTDTDPGTGAAALSTASMAVVTLGALATAMFALL